MEVSEDEFVPDLPDGEAGDENDEGSAALKRLREKLKKAIEEKQEYLEGWQRSRADFANYKREEVSMHGDKEERTKAELVESLLPALDALELALKHDNNPSLRMIEKQFLDSLKKFGVERFGAVGEEFDPHRHEALVKKSEEHVVISIERSGYQLGDKIIRPAQVVI